MLGVGMAFVSVQRGLVTGLQRSQLAFWALCYCVGHDSRAFGDYWVSGNLKGAMRAPLPVLVVLLCSVYRAFSCSLLFLGCPPLFPPLYYIFYIFSFIIYPVGSPLLFQFSVRGAGAGFFLAGMARGWVANRAGS